MIKTKVLFTVLALSASATNSAVLKEPYLLQVGGPSVVPSGCKGESMKVKPSEAAVHVSIKPNHVSATLTYQFDPDSGGTCDARTEGFALDQTPPQKVCDGSHQTVPDNKCIYVGPNGAPWQCRINVDYGPKEANKHSAEYAATEIKFSIISEGKAELTCDVYMNPNVDPFDSGVCAGACHANPLQADTY